MRVCLDTILPTFPNIYDLVNGGASFNMPNLPSNFYKNFACKAIESVQSACEVQMNQAITILYSIVEPILDALGEGLDIFPDIFGLPLKLFDIIYINISDLISKLTDGIKQTLINSILPFRNIFIGEVNILQAVYAAIKNYYYVYINIVQGLIDRVTGLFDIAGFALPTIPTMDQIINTLLSISGLSKVQDLWDSGVDIYGLFISTLSTFGIPFVLIDNLLGYLKAPQIEYTELLQNAMTQCINFLMQQLVEWVENTLSEFLDFLIPKLCYDI